MRRARIVVVALIATALLGAGAVVGTRRRGGRAVAAAVAGRAPADMRIRVQVLNATRTRGLARRATMLLRDRLFDVVETGTTSETRDTTLILDLSGHPDWASRTATLFTPSRIERRIDSSRYLDIAIVIGSTWRPPAQPFYP